MRMLVLSLPPPSRVIMPGFWAMFLICAYKFHSYIANTAEAQSIGDDLGSLSGLGCENYATVTPPSIRHRHRLPMGAIQLQNPYQQCPLCQGTVVHSISRIHPTGLAPSNKPWHPNYKIL